MINYFFLISESRLMDIQICLGIIRSNLQKSNPQST
jgi:hypothetical protein